MPNTIQESLHNYLKPLRESIRLFYIPRKAPAYLMNKASGRFFYDAEEEMHAVDAFVDAPMSTIQALIGGLIFDDVSQSLVDSSILL